MKKNTLSVLYVISLLLGCAFTAMAQNSKGDNLLGYWLNEQREAKIQIYRVGDKYSGKIVWLRDPIDTETGKPKLDKNSSDPKQHTVPVMGLNILKGFIFDGDSEWEDGTIYDPKNGKNYSCYIRFESKDRLKIRGYIGVSLLGRTTYWTRTTK